MSTSRPLTDAELADALGAIATDVTLPRHVLDQVGEATRATQQRERGWMMWPSSSRSQPVLRAVALLAGSFVVLAFGAFLAVGLLHPDGGADVAPAAVPSTTPLPSTAVALVPEALQGMRVEAVRPGILRVLDDGSGHPTEEARHVEVAPDGAVWIATEDGTIFRVGEAGGLDPENDGYPSAIKRFYALSDGTLAAHDDRWLSTTVDHGPPDGQEWLGGSGLERMRVTAINDVLRAQDGSLWVAATFNDGSVVYHLARLADGADAYYTWDDMGLPPDGWGIGHVAQTPDGSIWASPMSMDAVGAGLVRWVDGDWVAADPFGDGLPYLVSDLAVAPDGTLRAALLSDAERDGAWWFDGGWDGVGWTVEPSESRWSVGEFAPDGVRWTLGPLTARTDETTLDYQFPGPFSRTSVRDIAFTADGLLWLVMVEEDVTPVLPDSLPAGLYVVDPVTAAASTPERQELAGGEPIPVPLDEFGNDVVAQLFAIGDTWYAALDSIGPKGDRALGTDRGAENPIGTGASPDAAVEDALRPLGADLARRAADAIVVGDGEE